MNAITYNLCVNYQYCFFHDGHFSPFEHVQNHDTFFPLAIFGELGSILNLYCKTPRSPHVYTNQITDECADTFIYLLIYGLHLQNQIGIKVTEPIARSWNELPLPLGSDEELRQSVGKMASEIIQLTNVCSDETLSQNSFASIFSSLKSVNDYASRQNWQATIDSFHYRSLMKFTDPSNYTNDLRYRGSCWVDFGKLIEFAKAADVELPIKRFSFLRSMQALQN